MKAMSILFLVLLCSCSKEREAEYPKRLYWENGNTATQINDSIIIVSDRKAFNETESYIFNLNTSKITRP